MKVALLSVILLCPGVRHEWGCAVEQFRCVTRDPTGTIVFVTPRGWRLRAHGPGARLQVRCPPA